MAKLKLQARGKLQTGTAAFNTDALSEQTVSPSRILLLTAHPDDECFFFAPTILALRRSSSSPEIFSLCLSSGNADGLGERRKGELVRSLDILGVEKDNRWVIDHPQLQDNITQQWDAEIIAEVLRPFVIEHHITSILTFDTKGISLHPNHFSLPLGASYLIKSLSSSHTSVPRLFSLVTVPVLPKYAGLPSAILTRLGVISQAPLAFEPTVDSLPVFISGIPDYLTTVRAISAHDSQMVWFRYLYMTFSRYMWVNEWVEFKTQKGLGQDPLGATI
ncbi:putative deacetylase LmbE-like domain-containing protein [Suillus subalutaceus]|uniref:putative deacetylase LmbE-like domain-containing protein n=1 Tax=Suillus subalutaceus TaxID=48586 RepID=UPI001B86B916|nr:putative deacetylase LmbE-like domain-containing protein [Suillus subalutaceus]KAG1862797.1 putative deacetylase LmbE-like domain-containing protein [Suillus subalutaceus]